MIDKVLDMQDSGTLNSEKKERYRKIFLNDSADEATYREIYELLPEDKIVEKDRLMNDMPGLGFQRKVTKWKLNKVQDKILIDRLKAFALERKLGLNNKLFFNEHFEDIYIRSIYIVNE